ncbi:MAG: FAD-dependent oxidoreductase [Clostridiales bacterium]|jgi:glycine/D-amino acid oxidase-like deaminating enzyme|nr:FAD-dependent oxidoreductase [Clostridiales bacterium]
MESIWSAGVKEIQPKTHPALQGDVKTDVLVIGGGMAGILTAYRLQQAGARCIVAEAKTVGSGITQNTTAKVTAQHGLIYGDIIKKRGLDAAKMYLAANQQAVADFCMLAGRYPCDFEEQNAYVYSVDNRDKLEQEAQAYQKLGLSANIVECPSLPFSMVGALCMQHQGQFHPLRLLWELAKQLDIYEHTFIRHVQDGIACTEAGSIHAEHIVLATHYPMINIPGLYFMKLYQHRSYVLALEGAPHLDGMYVDACPEGFSFRHYQNLLLVGGGSHKTGKQGGGFAPLRALVKQAWPNASERYFWATQDCMSLDNTPYIGRHRAGTGQMYVATGMSKWGMTGSMVASRLLCDLILSGKSDLETLYSPRRPMAGGQLVSNIGSAAAGLLSIGGPRCTHMGCKLHKNGEEGTWDCPCHGSRFDGEGHVIDGPAKKQAHV